MTILKDVLAELIGMFLGDLRLSAAILGVVAVAAIMIDFGGLDPLIGGAVLLAGSLVVLVTAVRQAALRADGRGPKSRQDPA